MKLNSQFAQNLAETRAHYVDDENIDPAMEETIMNEVSRIACQISTPKGKGEGKLSVGQSLLYHALDAQLRIKKSPEEATEACRNMVTVSFIAMQNMGVDPIRMLVEESTAEDSTSVMSQLKADARKVQKTQRALAILDPGTDEHNMLKDQLQKRIMELGLATAALLGNL